jgi:hypothetical protein
VGPRTRLRPATYDDARLHGSPSRVKRSSGTFFLTSRERGLAFARVGRDCNGAGPTRSTRPGEGADCGSVSSWLRGPRFIVTSGSAGFTAFVATRRRVAVEGADLHDQLSPLGRRRCARGPRAHSSPRCGQGFRVGRRCPAQATHRSRRRLICPEARDRSPSAPSLSAYRRQPSYRTCRWAGGLKCRRSGDAHLRSFPARAAHDYQPASES